MQGQVDVVAADDLVEVHVSGKLSREVYEEFVPLLEEQIREHGKLRILFVMRDFHGWTAGAMWEDFKFDLAHFRDLRRVAMVGEKRWEHGMAIFCRPFTTAQVRYFPLSDLEAARDWVQETQPA
ncbi:STAS/SEC14 domain-containing protein [Engelhardtia mirabilis]|uniref:STAS/SEC14 domain-containing protein n=1 Tax=Engelhardtia mirabilis TaxID=2528011 RepID=A0A518BH88_9BACT|nr:hypothetical protein Pla133_14180 [Planctomycetes bacterium Pla133]QDV00674.1 hypothetical protein Pla86_14170 [Planctomycetes bacterium Pla86]